MANVLLHTAEEPVSLSALAVSRLLDRGDGDAALLYLALLRRQGNVNPRSLAGELRWEKGRIEAAEQVLRELELIAPVITQETVPDDRPEYQQSDVAMRLEDNPEFRGLAGQIEHLLGKKLTTPDLKRLLGLYDHLGLPAHIVYQLANHCTERIAARYGEGRRPTMKQIEQEGYVWARLGIYSQTAVEEYLRKDARRRASYAPYLRSLGMEDRIPVESEEKYLAAWQEMGFPPETVALAYDRTVLRCHEFRWSYCNGILRRWDKKGMHTPEEVEAGDRPESGRKSSKTQSATDEEIRKYARELHRNFHTDRR